MKTFGKTLSEVMKSQGVTQNELAERSGVYQSYISKLLTGHVSDPTFAKAKSIIHALGMTLQEFADLQDAD